MRTAERGHLAEWRRDVVGPAEGDVLEIAAGTGIDFPHYRAGVTLVATEPDLGMLEHVRVERPNIGWLQDLLTPVWRRLAGGCRLNERSVETVRSAGFHIDDLRSHMVGYIVTIEASTPSNPSRSLSPACVVNV